MDSYIENIGGNKVWYNKRELHRIDGPAKEWANGDKDWYINGKRHRKDGPAIEHINGSKYWWINGINITEEVLDWYKEMDLDLNISL